MTEQQATKEMVDGYSDGLDPHSPEPSNNRCACYRHGFANGRDDMNSSPRAFAQTLRQMADEAILLDVAS